MTEHDYTIRRWGHDYAITAVNGHTITMTGWGEGIEPGDHLILPNGDATTRYRVTTISYYRDPTDMWRAEAEFAPRRSTTEVSR
jgi:hypothetical protein